MASSGTDFANDVILATTTGSTFDATLAQLAAGEYDFKVYWNNGAIP